MACAERERLLDQLLAANNRLTAIHELEMSAVKDGDMSAFEALRPLLEKTREYREVVEEILKHHIRQHGC